MGITAIALTIIGVLATLSIVFLNVDLFTLRCPMCSAELEVDLDDDWVWAYEEGPLGWQPGHLKCRKCDWSSSQSRTESINKPPA